MQEHARVERLDILRVVNWSPELHDVAISVGTLLEIPAKQSISG
jgi:hypothetical protein